MREGTYYCNCTNPKCGLWYRILDPEKPCPKCGGKLEPQEVEDWNE